MNNLKHDKASTQRGSFCSAQRHEPLNLQWTEKADHNESIDSQAE